MRTNLEPRIARPDQGMYSHRASMLTEWTNIIYYQRLTAPILNEEPGKIQLAIVSEGIHQ